MSASILLGHGSTSFGRYEIESLLWEKRSVFTNDRRQEELEKCRLHGLVSKKIAFFEECYKGRLAVKSLQVKLDNDISQNRKPMNIDNDISQNTMENMKVHPNNVVSVTKLKNVESSHSSEKDETSVEFESFEDEGNRVVKENIKVTVHETSVTSAYRVDDHVTNSFNDKGIWGIKIHPLFNGEPLLTDLLSNKYADNAEPENRKPMHIDNHISRNTLDNTKVHPNNVVSVTKLKDSASFTKSSLSLDPRNKSKCKASIRTKTVQKPISKAKLNTQQGKKATGELVKEQFPASVASRREVTEGRISAIIPCPYSYATEHRAKRIRSVQNNFETKALELLQVNTRAKTYLNFFFIIYYKRYMNFYVQRNAELT